MRVIRAIPAGCVTSYGEVAVRAGLPGRARLVGRVLAESQGAALPWHRVMHAGGRIAFAPGTRGFREQARRLAAEGVLVVRGRVDTALHGWERNLDAVLWAPPAPVRAQRGTAKKDASSHKKP